MDMKAEMGSSRKAVIRPGISFDKSSNKQKQKHASDKGKQKNNFAGTAKKKNMKDRVAQRSLVAVEEKGRLHFFSEKSRFSETSEVDFELLTTLRKSIFKRSSCKSLLP